MARVCSWCGLPDGAWLASLEGLGTALKPAAEFWYLARKPLDGTVAATVTRWGTGALNIDGTRVGMDAGDRAEVDKRSGAGFGTIFPHGRDEGERFTSAPGGRWPPNVVLVHDVSCNGECVPGCPVAELDQQTSHLHSSGSPKGPGGWDSEGGWGFIGKGPYGQARVGDSGGASRFYPTFRYCAKPSTREKSAGLDHLPEKDRNREEWRLVENSTAKSGRRAEFPRRNTHPTVKPVELMRWLVRLVTPPGGTCLDPFAGSGTTLVAATLEGFDGIGIEAEAEYLPVIEGRLAWAAGQASEAERPGRRHRVTAEPHPPATGQAQTELSSRPAPAQGCLFGDGEAVG